MASAAAPQDAASPAAAAASAAADESLPELPLFSCKEAYVYRVPPATNHQAETWDVNNWLATVSLKVVQADDDAYVRLLADKTGELFAECPVPVDKPLVTAVEPVIDSSRYFVLRIVDRDSQRHAFIGIGFRERSEASDFNATLHEFLQYIKRKRTAEAMRHAYEERMQSATEEAASLGQAAAAAMAAPAADYSIKEGQTLHLKISAPEPVSRGFVSRAAARGQLGKTFSLLMDGHGGAVAALSPPPRAGSSPRLEMCVSPGLDAGGGSPMHTEGSGGAVSVGGGSGGGTPGRLGRVSGMGDAELQHRLQGLHLQQQAGGEACSSAASAASAASSSTAALPALEDDDFGDFEEAPEPGPQRQPDDGRG